MATQRRHLRDRRQSPFDWERFWAWIGLFALSIGALWGCFDIYILKIPLLLAELIA